MIIIVAALWSLFLVQPSGEISGAVRDARAGLPGVTVTVSGPTLEKPRTAWTSAHGTYRISELPQGRYVVVFSLMCFRPVRRTDVDVTIEKPVIIDAVLQHIPEDECFGATTR
jgi:hypothetical protein